MSSHLPFQPRRSRTSPARKRTVSSVALFATGTVAVSLALGAGTAGGQSPASPRTHMRMTTTPIKHVIVVIGENHSFDNVFATFRAANGEPVRNLLSEGIVKGNGSPGPHVRRARQRLARDTTVYRLHPTKTGAYAKLPAPSTTYISGACDGGQPQNAPDNRFPRLPNAPFQLTRYVPYHATAPGCPEPGAWVGDPLHRFYQMWQQNDGNRHDQYVWTANTAGDDNGAVPPAPISQGAVSMGFYNVRHGDAPLLTALARRYAMSDNYHQAVMGGTGVDHYLLGTGDFPYYQNARGRPTRPPRSQIENPNPLHGYNNAYTNDGYAGGSYTDCSNPNAPGVAAIMRQIKAGRAWNGGDCAPHHFYLLNNYNPAYNANGTRVDTTKFPFTVPPQTTPDIGSELSAHHVTWGFFGQGLQAHNRQGPTYCAICNPFQYSKAIMTNPRLRANIKPYKAFLADARAGTLPAVSYVKPSITFDGHPASSTLAAFESFLHRTLRAAMANRREWASTAVFVTMDESGGYYDSGYMAPLTFFGDGPRVPMIVVSPWAKRHFVSHRYDDHASILKFIERNWSLRPLTSRSLDNLPNPVTALGHPYVPVNGPAVGDLMNYFTFSRTD